MKNLTCLYTLLAAGFTLAACSDHDYICNDPEADLNAPAYHDVNDLYQTYNLFWKPADGWVGDPMPFYENGQYYVMYLHDARDGGDTFHPFAMASTTDFTSFTDHGIVVPCGADNSQEDALGTGSTIKVGDTYYTYYTGHNNNLWPAEKIYLATSKDLLTWTKQTDFVLEAPLNDVDRNEFRDPFILKEDDVYKMLITSRAYVSAVNDWQAVILQYSSTDMLNWSLEDPFYYNGERMLECPDVFTMGNYQYLIYSNWDWAETDRRTRYVYREAGSNTWITPEQPALDDHFFYAGKTAGEGSERYLFGWCYTRENHKDSGSKVWGGSLVVHKLLQNSDGTLKVAIPTPICSALSSEIDLLGKVMDGASYSNSQYVLKSSGESKAVAVFDGIRDAYRIHGTLNTGSSQRCGFEFGASGNRSEVHDLVFDMQASTLNLERILNGQTVAVVSSVNLPQGNEFDIDIIVENAVCVAYINGEKALTNRIYQMNRNGWGLFTQDGEATFSIKAYK